jgi:protein CpxP
MVLILGDAVGGSKKKDGLDRSKPLLQGHDLNCPATGFEGVEMRRLIRDMKMLEAFSGRCSAYTVGPSPAQTRHYAKHFHIIFTIAANCLHGRRLFYSPRAGKPVRIFHYLDENKTMNKTLLTLAIVISFPLAAAAFPGAEGPGSEGHQKHRIERLTKDLNLTDEQKSKVETIFKEQHDKFKALREETHSKLGTVLTPEQIAKFEELKKQHRGHWKHKKAQKNPE